MGGKPDDAALSKDLEDYEIFDDDVTRARLAISESTHTVPWINPEVLKLKHRIGRGPFGDVWLATLHSSSEDFDVFHEVAAKLLSSVNEEHVPDLFSKVNQLFQKCQSLKHVSWPQGISRKNGKVCIIMEFYEGSIGDKMARLKGNRIPLTDVLRYGLDLAHGVMELHSVGILALNLKPCNFLLDDQDKAILGEFGIPMLLLGSSFSNTAAAVWMGTPNYMAPEQWNPDVRGPISIETDSWGFGCSIIEMVTGTRPWHQLSTEDIYSLVVVKQEKPSIPNGLPSAIKNILRGCFEFDYRKRPSFSEIVHAFESPQVIFREGDWVRDHDGKVAVVKSVVSPDSFVLQYSDKKNELVNGDGVNKLSFWKNSFKVGDRVQLKDAVISKDFSELHEHIRTEGTVAGINTREGSILVRFSESQEPVNLSPAAIERVSSGFVIGDLVRLHGGWPSDVSTALVRSPSSVGMVHGIDSDGKLKVAFLGKETLWTCNTRDLEKMKPFCVGQFVKIRSDVVSPRFQWPLRKDRCWDTGRIVRIAPNGCLIVSFPGRVWNWDEWWADPEEVKVVQMNDYISLLDKYHHLEAMHWSVRPLVFTVALFSALKLGTGFVRILPLPGRHKKKRGADTQKINLELVSDGQSQGKDSVNAGNPPWLHPSVANILFRDGAQALQ